MVNDTAPKTQLSLEIDQIVCEIEAIELAEQPQGLSLVRSTEVSKLSQSSFDIKVINHAIFKISQSKPQKRRKQ